jgi:phosphatidylserine decarboxylase
MSKNVSRKRRIILYSQIAMLVVCFSLVLEWGLNFPYPSIIVKPFLQPRQRWPEKQIKEGLARGEHDEKCAQDFLKFFYRDPERVIPKGKNVVSPADGTLRYIDTNAGQKYLVIAMSFWDVHVQRCPCDAKIIKIESGGDRFMDGEGKKMVYLKDKISPVQKIVTLQTEWGLFKVRLITSLSARRIEVWVKEGQEVKKGERLSRILAGSTVVLEIPATLNVIPQTGTKVVGGETILCEP